MKFLFSSGLVAACASAYSAQQAELSRQLSAYAYCKMSNYLTQDYSDAAEGFVATSIIDNETWKVIGFTGYLPSDESIYVVFKGTTDAKEWAMNLDVTQSDYDVWPECNCKVHAGWYNGLNLVWDSVKQEVTRLQALYPSYKVKVTGHSLGGALA